MLNLKVTKETRGSAGVPLPPPTKLAVEERNPMFPTGYEFPIARLVNVVFTPDKKIKDGEEEKETPVLSYVFKDKKDRQFTHIEFPLKEDDGKLEMKQDALIQRVKHIWDETIGEEHFKELEGATYAEFFKNVADAFNSILIPKEGTDKKVKKYTQSPLYIKLVYYKTRLQIPMFPNFLQEATANNKQIPCESLLINLDNDKVEPEAKARGNNNKYNQDARSSEFAGEGIEDDFPDI